MRKTCFYHAGCPDGFGAAYSVWRAWGDDGHYVGRSHDDRVGLSFGHPVAHLRLLGQIDDIAAHADDLATLLLETADHSPADHTAMPRNPDPFLI